MLLFESDPSSVPPFLSFFLSLGPFLNDDCKVSGFLGPLVTVTIPQSPSLPSTFGYPIQCRHHLNMAPFSVSLSPSSRSHLPPPCSSLTLLACLVWWARAPPAHHHCTQGCQMAKCEPFLSLDCTRVKGGGRNPRKGRDQILQRSVAIVLQVRSAKPTQSKNWTIAIWQPVAWLWLPRRNSYLVM